MREIWAVDERRGLGRQWCRHGYPPWRLDGSPRGRLRADGERTASLQGQVTIGTRTAISSRQVNRAELRQLILILARSLAWAGGRSSPSGSCLLRRRTDRRHRTRAPKRSLRAASRASLELLPFEDRPASNRSRRLPRWRARALRRPR